MESMGQLSRTHSCNALGKENWEMVEAAQVGPLLMFFFKRPGGLPPVS